MAAFTATATPEVRDDIVQLLGLADPRVVVAGFDRPNITLVVLTVALTVPTLAAAPPQRSFSAGSFGLELDGTFVGFVAKVEGVGVTL